MATTGTAATTVIGIIIGIITTADGVGGTATGGVIPGITSCSLAALAFHGGGAGAGALGQAGAGAAAGAAAGDLTTVIPTDPAIPITAMATATTQNIRIRTASLSTINLTTVVTEAAANPGSQSCNDVCPRLAITMDPLMESLGRRLVAQSAITSSNTAT